MNPEFAIIRLTVADQSGINVMRKSDLVELFQCQDTYRYRRLVRQLLDRCVLKRVSRGVYVNLAARSSKRYLIEEIACVLRKGHFNYVSLESICSEFGIISQVMTDRITIMTTGASGRFETPYGVIEFTHTGRSVDFLRKRTVKLDGRPLRLATAKAGVADLQRVGRNVDMLDVDELAMLDAD